jgi:putative DNA primase/helicase
LHRESDARLPALEAFEARIRALLDTPLPTDERGCLIPEALGLSADAKRGWVRFHDDVERDIGARGELRHVRDVAAKVAENAARMGALFHAFDRGTAGQIGAEQIERTGRIVAWHLTEARRLCESIDVPAPLAAAIKLDAWLRAEALAIASGRIPTRRIRQYGPAAVRDDIGFQAAMRELEHRGRARFERDGKQRLIVLNPALLTGAP